MDVCNFNWNVMGLRMFNHLLLYIYNIEAQNENKEIITIDDGGFKLTFYRKMGDVYFKYYDGVAWLLLNDEIISTSYYFNTKHKKKLMRLFWDPIRTMK